jgi:hypothetical protein
MPANPETRVYFSPESNLTPKPLGWFITHLHLAEISDGGPAPWSSADRPQMGVSVHVLSAMIRGLLLHNHSGNTGPCRLYLRPILFFGGVFFPSGEVFFSQTRGPEFLILSFHPPGWGKTFGPLPPGGFYQKKLV